jgi:regulatory subunit of type II PKA R-subunit
MNRGSRLEVPQELTIILLNFTVSVLVNKPSNLIEYASQYFTRMWEEQKNTNIPKTSKSEDHNHNHFEDENDDSYFSDFSKYIKFYFITIHILFLNTRPKYNYI